jgi:NAD(P)-dependent dehydrogenase (short-subunit alcohol dehydrogenase family)
MRLKGKVVLVTGGNSGIGRGIALRAAAEGARVAITGRDTAKGDRVLAELKAAGAESAFFVADLGDEDAARAMLGAVAARFQGLDVVVNNAGAGTRRADVLPEHGAGERLRRVMRPNLDAAYHVSAHALPLLRARGGGAIVNISSTASIHGTWGNYGIAKAAIEALTRSLAVQGAPFGIRANGVSPGWIATDVTAGSPETDRAASLLGRMGTPDEIARAVLFLASDEASYVTGQTLIVDGGLTITDYPSQPWLATVGTWKLFPDMGSGGNEGDPT